MGTAHVGHEAAEAGGSREVAENDATAPEFGATENLGGHGHGGEGRGTKWPNRRPPRLRGSRVRGREEQVEPSGSCSSRGCGHGQRRPRQPSTTKGSQERGPARDRGALGEAETGLE